MNDTLLYPSILLTTGFVVALLLGLLLKFWLSFRQIRHVTLHRNQLPTAFAQTITLAAHHKAADYTVVKVRFGQLEMVLGTLVLLGWTLLGGLSALNLSLIHI